MGVELTFQAWVEGLIRSRFRTATSLARLVGMELSPFNRGVRAGTLNVTNLLKLAQVAEAHPSDVLRLAGKADEAALIEELYGNGREALTPSQRELVETWDAIPDDARAHWAVLLQRARQQSSGGPPAIERLPTRRQRRRGVRAQAASKHR